MTYLLALDQGATKTEALVADATGQILGVGFSAGANHVGSGMAKAMAEIKTAAQIALDQASLTFAQLALVSAGIAGADYPDQFVALEENLIATTGVKRIKLVNDCVPAYWGGSDSPAGAVICAGSAMNAAIFAPGREPFVYADYVLPGDHAGMSLGQAGMSAVFAAETEMGPPTSLTGILLEHYQETDVFILLQRYIFRRLGHTKDIAPLIIKAADEGDEVAYKLVTDQARRMARYATVGLKRFGMLDAPAEVVLSGGIFKAQLPRQTATEAIQADAPLAKVVSARYEPLVGAMLMGLRELSDGPFSLDDPVIQTSVERFGLNRP